MGGIKRDYTRGIVKFTARALLVTIFLLITLLAVQGIFSPFHVVKGDSMSPGIQNGDAITIKKINPTNVGVGQVVAYSEKTGGSEAISVERVVDVRQYESVTLFYMNGDTDPAVEPAEVSAAAVIGSPSFNVPKLGYILDVILTPAYFVTCILILGAAALIMMHLCAKIDSKSVVNSRKSRISEQKEMIACSRSFV